MENTFVTSENIDNKPKNNKIKSFFKNIFKNHLNAFIFTTIILFIILIVLVCYPLCLNTFLNCNTDDILQYYTYISGFFDKIKHGEFSLYDTSLIGGASFFSSVYYIPLDIFLAFAFILSFFMQTEIAYFISNMLRVIGGSLLIFYIFKRKGFKPSSCTLLSLIFFVSGLTEVEMVFPVYLGICFYAPLGMLIIDLVIEKRGIYFLLVPIYGLTIMLYDFYIAYMLYAFICVYFVVRSSMLSKRFFLIDKTFWLNFIEFILVIILSILMSCMILIPSAFYILNESSRTSQTADYLWYYTVGSGSDMKISIRHYFTALCNYFIPNNPFSLCLIDQGDYIREHFSFYMTSGGILFLGYFFMIGKKENHRLKAWIVIFNLMFLIPLCAMIFTFQSWAYSRWFFIPFMLNFYGMAIGLDTMSKRVFDENKDSFPLFKIIPFIFLVIGLLALLYALLIDQNIHTERYFIHYTLNSDFFYPILIISIVLISLYIIFILLMIVSQFIKKIRLIKLAASSILLVIVLEVIYSLIISFCDTGSTSFLTEHEIISYEKEHLYDLGYDVKDGYRINLYTSYAKSHTNANILVNNVNYGNFFQSFYNTPLNSYKNYVHGDTSTSWSSDTIYGYSLLSGPMFNMGYIVTSPDCGDILLPESYYTLLDDSYYINGERHYYYKTKDLPQFIVYDNVFKGTLTGHEHIYRDLALLESGWIEYQTDEDNKNYKKLKSNYNKIIESGINETIETNLFKDLEKNSGIERFVISNPTLTDSDQYYTYELPTSLTNAIKNSDMFYVRPGSSDILKKSSTHIYIADSSESDLVSLHYNMGYSSTLPISDSWSPSVLKVNITSTNDTKTTYVYTLNSDLYQDFIEKQATYNQEFSLDGTNMHISFTNTDGKAKVIKTAYSYSDDWKVKTKGYETCNIDGGFLGIIVKNTSENEKINIDLTFEPYGYSQGLKISLVGCIIYIGLCASAIFVINRKRKERVDLF